MKILHYISIALEYLCNSIDRVISALDFQDTLMLSPEDEKLLGRETWKMIDSGIKSKDVEISDGRIITIEIQQ